MMTNNLALIFFNSKKEWRLRKKFKNQCIIIEKDRILAENWNPPHDIGVIDPANFSPYPKNPVIAKFFKEIGRVDELGLGVRNTFKYGGIYAPGTKPEFIEDDIFRTIIQLKAKEGKKAVSASY